MVGNKAQKAVAAALTGMMVLGSAAPAFAGVSLDNNWYRLDGTYHTNGVNNYDQILVDAGLGVQTPIDKDVPGVDRYDTMLDAVLYNAARGDWKADYTYGADGKYAPATATTVSDVVLVSGTSFADSLSASGLAGVFGSPVITTPADKLGEEAEIAIKYFAQANGGKLNVWIVGGNAAVSDKVQEAVEGIKASNDGTAYDGKTAATSMTVKAFRRAGNDRMETSLAVMKAINEQVKLQADKLYNDTVFVANGTAWADALSVSSFAYERNAPLLLTDSEGYLSDEQVSYVKEKLEDGAFVWCVGGPAETAYDQLSMIDFTVKNGFANKSQVRWIVGDDRYDTNAEVIKQLVDWKLDKDGKPIIDTTIAVATGKNFPDALVGGAFVGAQGGILVLAGEAGTTNWDEALGTIQELNNKGLVKVDTAAYSKFILGGTSAVDKATANEITHFIN